MKYKKLSLNSASGFILPAVLSFIVVVLILSGALLEIINTNLSNVNNNVKSQQAFNVAEAGINYYLWHLSHNGTDYQDGTATCKQDVPSLGCGAYKHDYYDSNLAKEGYYELYVKPKGGGSTVVTIRAVGHIYGDNSVRTIEAQIGAASFASYGVVADGALWFGNNETASGPVHSNQGIELDGPNTDTATAAGPGVNGTYIPPDGLHSNNYPSGQSHPGVWCDTSVTTPNCNTRDKTSWTYPVTSVNFPNITQNLCSLKKIALADDPSTLVASGQACNAAYPSTRTKAYLPQICANNQNNQNCSYTRNSGYLIKLNNNKTYDVLKVTNENDRLRPYTSALTTQPVATGVAYPASGVLFAEDNVWVLSNPSSPLIDGRLTIVAARPGTSSNTTHAEVTIVGAITYKAKDGTVALGLISQGSVFLAPYAPPAVASGNANPFTFEIDGALLASNYNVTYGENSEDTTTCGIPPQVCYQWSYRTNKTSNPAYPWGWTGSNQKLLMYGSVGVRQTWTWNIDYGAAGVNCGTNYPNLAYDSNPGTHHCFSGIMNTVNQYDYNLLYSPPPNFPLANGYQILSWREVLTHP